MKYDFLPKINRANGFTLVELLAYLFITCMLLIMIVSLVMNIFYARKKFQVSDAVDSNARYIMNFVLNKVHNVDIISDGGGDPANVYFYNLPSYRFNLALESNNLFFRQTEDTGSGFPDQSTATPLSLNTKNVRVSDFSLVPLADNRGEENQGVLISFTIAAGDPSDPKSFAQKSFNTFLSIR
ncbi:MAG: prepilin-type N-terminal cleavage/methylation domain-containing protein [Patescibacteria group bacterium]